MSADSVSGNEISPIPDHDDSIAHRNKIISFSMYSRQIDPDFHPPFTFYSNHQVLKPFLPTRLCLASELNGTFFGFQGVSGLSDQPSAGADGGVEESGQRSGQRSRQRFHTCRNTHCQMSMCFGTYA